MLGLPRNWGSGKDVRKVAQDNDIGIEVDQPRGKTWHSGELMSRWQLKELVVIICDCFGEINAYNQ